VDKSAIKLDEITLALRSQTIPNRIWKLLTDKQKEDWVERITK